MTIAQRIARRILTSLTGVDVLTAQDSAERTFRRAAMLEDEVIKMRSEMAALRSSMTTTPATAMRWRGVNGEKS